MSREPGGSASRRTRRNAELFAQCGEILRGVSRPRLGQPFTGYGRTIDLTASIGIAVSHGADDPMRLVENADTAMYDAKRAGRDRFATFDPDERTSQLNRLATEFALRRAVDHGGRR